jgi:hypothetical protein
LFIWDEKFLLSPHTEDYKLWKNIVNEDCIGSKVQVSNKLTCEILITVMCALNMMYFDGVIVMGILLLFIW